MACPLICPPHLPVLKENVSTMERQLFHEIQVLRKPCIQGYAIATVNLTLATTTRDFFILVTSNL